MKNKDLIAALQALDPGSGAGIYTDINIEVIESSWIGLTFSNEDEDLDGFSPRTCRVCGCTDENCRQCVEKTGQPCYWVAEDLCSACVEPESKLLLPGKDF